MKLTFAQRRAGDTRFAREVEDLQGELVFMAFGIDPQALVDAFQDGVIDRSKLGLPEAGKVKLVKPTPAKAVEAPEAIRANPVADLTGKAAVDAMKKLAASGDLAGLVAARDQDVRKSVAQAANEMIFTLRTS